MEKRVNIGKSISKRANEVRKRETLGHLELGTVISGHGQARDCVSTLLNGKTRWYTGIVIPNRSAQSMGTAIGNLHEQLPKNAIQTATTDCGKN